MSNNLKLTLLAILCIMLGTATFLLFRPTRSCHSNKPSGLSWLQSEFNLDPATFQTIGTLHEKYQTECRQMCTDLAQSRIALARQIENNTTLTTELQAQLQKHAELETTCRTTMLNHLYAVANHLPPDKRTKYLQMANSCLFNSSTSLSSTTCRHHE